MRLTVKAAWRQLHTNVLYVLKKIVIAVITNWGGGQQTPGASELLLLIPVL